MGAPIGQLDPTVPSAQPTPPQAFAEPISGPLVGKCFPNAPTRVTLKAGAQPKKGLKELAIFDALIPSMHQAKTWHWGLFELGALGVPNFPLADGQPLSLNISSGECDFRAPVEVQLFARDPELIPGELFNDINFWLSTVKTGPLQNDPKDDWQLQAVPSPLGGLLQQLTLDWPPRVDNPSALSVMYPGIRFQNRLPNQPREKSLEDLATPKPISDLLPSTIPTKKKPQDFIGPAMFNHGFSFGPHTATPTSSGSIKAIRIIQNVGPGGCASHFRYADLLQPIVDRISATLSPICRSASGLDVGVRFARLVDAVIVPTLRHSTGDIGVQPDAGDSRGGFFVYVHVIIEQGDIFGGCSFMAAQEYEFRLDNDGMLRLVPTQGLDREQSHGGVSGNACDDHGLWWVPWPIAEQTGVRNFIRGLLKGQDYFREHKPVPGSVKEISDFVQWFPTWGVKVPTGVPDIAKWCPDSKPNQAIDVGGYPVSAVCCDNKNNCALGGIAEPLKTTLQCPPHLSPCANFKQLLIDKLNNPAETRVDPWTGALLGDFFSEPRVALRNAIANAPERCVFVATDFTVDSDGFGVPTEMLPMCQLGIPIKRLVAHPDEIVSVLWEDADDFDSVARALDVITQVPSFQLTPGTVSQNLCQPIRNPVNGAARSGSNCPTLILTKDQTSPGDPNCDAPGDPWAWLANQPQPTFAAGQFDRVRPSSGDIEDWGVHEAIWRQEFFNSISGWDTRSFPVFPLSDEADPSLSCIAWQDCFNRAAQYAGDSRAVGYGKLKGLAQWECCRPDGSSPNPSWKKFHDCFPFLLRA
jgi:hypothetical protein